MKANGETKSSQSAGGPLKSQVQAVAVAVGDGGDYTDYQLRPNWEAIAAETAQATRERHEEAERIAAAESGMQEAASDWTKAWQIIAQALKEMRAPNCDQNARAIIARLAGYDLLIVRSEKVKD